MTLTKEVIEEFKARLLEEKTKIENDLGRFAKRGEGEDNFVTTFEDIGTDRDDNAHEVENYGDNLALEKTLETRLQKISKALDKIETGEYGKCEVCGNDVTEERLKANPEASKCIKCA